MIKVVVTGAAGFTGTILVKALRKNGYQVYAIVRPGSSHNSRLEGDPGVVLIPAELSELEKVAYHIPETCDIFFHLAWTGGRDFDSQMRNVEYTLKAVDLAKKLGCHRFICTGSQAEYGVIPPDEITMENRMSMPITPYGSVKVAACYLSRQYASELGIEWIWGRIFSLIGQYEPRGRMLPDLYWSLKAGRDFHISSGSQNWDYLDVHDAAEAIIALAEHGKPGEIYNIAHGEYRNLKLFTEEMREYMASEGFNDGRIIYGEDPDPFISLQPSVEKIRRDTGWQPQRSFLDSVKDYER